MKTVTTGSGSTAERYCPTCEKSFTSATRCPDDGTQLVSLERDDKLAGANLDGRYTIDERIGQGGMGAVYRATQHSVGRDVAVKVVRPDLFADPTVIKRFLREAKLASRLTHPNAVAVLDFGQTAEGLFYLVMELLDGEPLDKLLKREGRLAMERAIHIASQICDALDGAHELEIVHRDLKPGNVMLIPGAAGRDLVKVLDFGLAKSLSGDIGSQSVTRSGAMLGTPAYMPPELAIGKEADARTDLYSLGCILYVMLSGRLPFIAETLHELVNQHATATPPPIPGVPPTLSTVVMKLLAKEPADRYATADETHHALELARRRLAPSDITIGAGSAPSAAREASGLGASTPSSAGFEETATPSIDVNLSTVLPDSATMGAPARAPARPTVPAPAPAKEEPAVTAPPPAGRKRVAWIAGVGVLAAGGVVAWRLTRTSAVATATADAAPPVATAVDAAGVAPPPPPVIDAAALPATVVDAAPEVPSPPDARVRNIPKPPRPDAAPRTTPPPATPDARPVVPKPKPDAGTPF